MRPAEPLPDDAASVLTTLARAAIADELREPGPPASPRPVEPEWLSQPGASFVTLTIGGTLRGCIGSLEAWRPLGADVSANAVAAAFRDPRFPALSAAEYDRVAVEVSVLTAPEPVAFTSRDDLLAQLRPGVDGLILTARGRRGTFLPQVWDELPEPVDFLAHLLRKAGLPASYWGADVEIERYTVTAFHETP